MKTRKIPWLAVLACTLTSPSGFAKSYVKVMGICTNCDNTRTKATRPETQTISRQSQAVREVVDHGSGGRTTYLGNGVTIIESNPTYYSAPPRPKADGENGYEYHYLFDSEIQNTPGAKFIESLIKDPAFTEAIRADQELKNKLLDDPLLEKEYERNFNYYTIMERGPSLKFLYSESSGAGYSIAGHTARVLNNFDQQAKFYNFDAVKLPEGVRKAEFPRLMKTLMAFHDIGKSVAVASGDKSRQDRYNSLFLPTLLKAARFNPAEIELARALNDSDDEIGGFLQGKHGQESTIGALRRQADRVKMELPQFFHLQRLYFTSDAASYPELRNSVFNSTKNGRLSPAAEEYQTLADAAGYKEPPPAGGYTEDNYPVGRLVADGYYWGSSPFARTVVARPEVNMVLARTPKWKDLIAKERDFQAIQKSDPALAGIILKGPSLEFLLSMKDSACEQERKKLVERWQRQSMECLTSGERASREIDYFVTAATRSYLDRDTDPVFKRPMELGKYTLLLRQVANALFPTDREAAEAWSRALRRNYLFAAGFSDAEIQLSDQLLASRFLRDYLQERKEMRSKADPKGSLDKARAQLKAESEALKIDEKLYLKVLSAYTEGAGRRSYFEDEFALKDLVRLVKTGEYPTEEKPAAPQKGDGSFYYRSDSASDADPLPVEEDLPPCKNAPANAPGYCPEQRDAEAAARRAAARAAPPRTQKLPPSRSLVQ